MEFCFTLHKIGRPKTNTCFEKRGDEARWNVVFGLLKNEGYEFYFTLHLFLLLLFFVFVGSFFNVMVVGPTSLKEEGEERERGKALLLQLSNFGIELGGRGGEGNFWSCGRLNLWKVNLELSFFRGGWCKSSQAFGKLGGVGKS
jgi:hypothetical protein